jgi:hypothetical protein
VIREAPDEAARHVERGELYRLPLVLVRTHRVDLAAHERPERCPEHLVDLAVRPDSRLAPHREHERVHHEPSSPTARHRGHLVEATDQLAFTA